MTTLPRAPPDAAARYGLGKGEALGDRPLHAMPIDEGGHVPVSHRAANAGTADGAALRHQADEVGCRLRLVEQSHQNYITTGCEGGNCLVERCGTSGVHHAIKGAAARGRHLAVISFSWLLFGYDGKASYASSDVRRAASAIDTPSS